MKYKFDYTKYIDSLVPLFKKLELMDKITPKKLARLIKKYAKT